MGNEASVPAGTSSADTTCGTRVRPTTPAPAWLESTATSAEAPWTEINDEGGTDKPPARETSGAVDGDGNLFLIGGRDAKDEYADVHVRGAAGGWFKPEPAGRPPRATSLAWSGWTWQRRSRGATPTSPAVGHRLHRTTHDVIEPHHPATGP